MSSWILAHLHPTIRIAWDEMGPYGIPAAAKDIDELRQHVSDIPAEYLELVGEYEVLSVKTIQNAPNFFALSLLRPADIVGYLDWYPPLQEELPGIFVFATDGDNCYFIGKYNEKHGVYKMEISVAGWENADYWAPSIRALLCDGVGWETLD